MALEQNDEFCENVMGLQVALDALGPTTSDEEREKIHGLMLLMIERMLFEIEAVDRHEAPATC